MSYLSPADAYEQLGAGTLGRTLRPRTDGRGADLVLYPLPTWGAAREAHMRSLLRELRASVGVAPGDPDPWNFRKRPAPGWEAGGANGGGHGDEVRCSRHRCRRGRVAG
jgi:hypothetical protein